MRMHSWAILFLALVVATAGAQENPNLEAGLKPYGSFNGGDIDTISLTNGNLNIRVPFWSVPQRGSIKYNYILVYNSKAWSNTTTCGPVYCSPRWIPAGSGGAVFLAVDGQIFTGCTQVVSQPNYWIPWKCVATAADGTSHKLYGPIGYGKSYAVDASGIAFYSNESAWDPQTNTTYYGGYTVDRQGNRFESFAWGTQHPLEDSNLNYLMRTGTTTDTMGRTIPSQQTTTNYSDCAGPRPTTSAKTLTFTAPNGGTSIFKLCNATVALQTAFPNPPGTTIAQYSANRSQVQSIVLPNGSKWIFEYDAYGDLLKLTFPTGGTLSYTWGTKSICTDFSSSTFVNQGKTPMSRIVLSRTLDANDGTGPHTMTYAWGTETTNGTTRTWGVTVRDPEGNEAVHVLSGINNSCAFYVTESRYYQGLASANVLLKTVRSDYTTAGTQFGSQTGAAATEVMAAVPIRTTTIWPNGKTSKAERDYDSFTYQYQNNFNGQWSTYQATTGNVTALREYDYGAGAPGSLLRTTENTYLYAQNGAYLSNHLVDRMASVVVKDGNGGTRSSITYTYDEFPLQPSSVTTGHRSTSWSSSFSPTARGNRTSENIWDSATGNTLRSTLRYFDTGQLYQKTDVAGNTTTFSYSPTYVGAYLTQTQDAAAHAVTATYHFDSGLITSFTDPNQRGTTYTYDSNRRFASAVYPDQGRIDFFYPDAVTIERRQKLDATRSTDLYVRFDGVGREIRRATANDEAIPWDQVDSCYDARGLKRFVSHPYQGYGLSDPQVCSGAGDTYSYDALKRAASVTHADGSSITTSYLGAATATADEGNGTSTVQRITQHDPLGRLLSVCEVSSQVLIGSNGSPTNCGQDIPATGFLSTYSYDTLGNLTSVVQPGLNPRTYVFDSLSRILTETTPEGGASTYSFYRNGTPCSGNIKLPCSRTDSRGVTTTNTYDVLSRLISKTFSDGTSGAFLGYDQATALGKALANTVGRKSSMYTSSGPTTLTGSVFSYDTMGRVVDNSQCTPQNCGISLFAIGYGYDLAGNSTSWTVGQGITLSSSYNRALRPTNVGSSLIDAVHPANLLSSAAYNSFGSPTALTLGNGVAETRSYDQRGRLIAISDNVPSDSAPSWGTVVFSGAPKPSAPGSVAITISGDELSEENCDEIGHCFTIWDSGNVSITINGLAKSASFGRLSTATSIATDLAAAFKADANSPVSASRVGSVITFTSKLAGPSGNYPFSTASQSSLGSFEATPMSGSLSGGADADSGTISVNVNGYIASTTFGQSSTSVAIAGALATTFTNAPTSPVDGTNILCGSGPDPICNPSSTLTLTTRASGAGTQYPLSVTISGLQQPPSFSSSTSGSALIQGIENIYGLTLTLAPNGDVLASNDTNGKWQYSYDDFNRLLTAATFPTNPLMYRDPEDFVTYGYAYDRFGNRWQQNVTFGTGYSSVLTFGAGNRIQGQTYDPAGNLLGDGTHTYQYDAEGRITNVDNGQAATYLYDADGRRVRKTVGSTGKDYLYDLSGRVIGEVNATGQWTRAEAFAGNRHLAVYANSATFFPISDWLGSERLRTDLNGVVTETFTNHPFGDAFVSSTGDNGVSPNHFTGKERDSESGLHNFGARYYSPSLGRFLSVDPSSESINGLLPQTWNRYPYSLNNPLSVVDRNGKWPGDIHDEIYRQAFPGLSARQLKAIQDGSRTIDECATCQMELRTHEHAMRRPGQSVSDAQRDMIGFIVIHQGVAQEQQGAFEKKGGVGMSIEALREFGKSGHPTTDESSPMHHGFQEWKNPVEHPWDALFHSTHEKTIQPAEMDEAVAAVQKLYGETFGQDRLAQAMNPNHKAIAEEEEKEQEKKQEKPKTEEKKPPERQQ